MWAVGPDDLTLDGLPAAKHERTPRTFGTELLKRYEDIRAALQVPPLDEAIAYLRDVGEPAHQVVLVVTDQPEGSPGFEQDTFTFGPLIERYVGEHYRLERKVRIRRLRCGDTSIDEVGREVDAWLGAWRREYDSMSFLVNLAVPAVSTALLLGCLDSCPDKTTALDRSTPRHVRPMDVVRRVRISSRRRDVCTAIEHGRFGAALNLLGDEEDVGVPGYIYRTLHAALESADQRLRFDLESARRTLAAARKESELPQDLYQEVVEIQGGLPLRDDSAGLLRELYHNAIEKLRHGEYADFILRLFNFQQAALRRAAEQRGVRFVRRGEYLDPSWLDAHPQFVAFAGSWKSPDGSTDLRLDGGRATGLLLLCLTSYLQSERSLTREILQAAEGILSVVELRNRCFAAHDFAQVSLQDITGRFGASTRDLVDAMWVLYAGASGQSVGPDPFTQTINLCQRLLQPNGA